MNVFGSSIEGERNKIILNLESSNQIIIANINKINQLIDVQEKTIKTLEQKIQILDAALAKLIVKIEVKPTYI